MRLSNSNVPQITMSLVNDIPQLKCPKIFSKSEISNEYMFCFLLIAMHNEQYIKTILIVVLGRNLKKYSS